MQFAGRPHTENPPRYETRQHLNLVEMLIVDNTVRVEEIATGVDRVAIKGRPKMMRGESEDSVGLTMFEVAVDGHKDSSDPALVVPSISVGSSRSLPNLLIGRLAAVIASCMQALLATRANCCGRGPEESRAHPWPQRADTKSAVSPLIHRGTCSDDRGGRRNIRSALTMVS